MKRTVSVLLIVASLAVWACVRSRQSVDHPRPLVGSLALSLAGQFSIPPLGRFPADAGLQFGGISGLAAVDRGQEMLGISDDREGLRVYRFRLGGEGTSFRVEIVEQISLDAVRPAPAGIDPEAIARLPNGNLLITSDGIGTEPRVGPAIVEYTPHGGFLRSLPVRDRFVPNPHGPLQKGVRGNLGFESLTLMPDQRRFFTAVEAPIVQDGDLTSVERGARTRLLEYVRDGDRFEPAREFAYTIEPVARPPFEADTAVNGIVELLALGNDELLALERSFVAEAGDTGRNLNRIRLFRVDLEGATDVSAIESLRDLAGLTAARKVLVLDLSDAGGLSPELAPGLDNFEGLAFGPRLVDGRSTLIVVSDDNFNGTQRTWFLQFSIGRAAAAQQIQ